MNHRADRNYSYDWKAPLTSYDIFHEIDGKAYLQSILDGEYIESPMAQTLGLRLAEIDDGYAVYTVEPTEYHYNPIGSVHGGLAASLFDTALSSAIMTKLAVGMMSVTVELHVHYLRALSTKTGRVRCEAHTIHVGRTLATAEAKLIGEKDGKIYGHASITSVVMPAPQGDMPIVQTEGNRSFSWEDPLLSARDAMRMVGLDYMRSFIDSQTPPPPIAKTLGMSGIHRVDAGQIRFGTYLGGWQMNSSGTIHGGLIATLCDSALGCSIHTTMPTGMAYTTSELNINFVRPVTTSIKQLYADATVLHSGNTIATAEAKVVDDEGILYAHATTTCLVFPLER